MAKVNLKFLQLFDSQAKFQAFSLVIFMIIGAILETFSIGIIPAFIYLLNKPDIIKNNLYLRWLYQLLRVNSTQQLLIYLTIALIIIYIVKNLYLTFSTYIQSRFIFNQQIKLSRRLFSSYLFYPYTFHLQRNPAELIFYLNSEVNTAFRQVIIPMMTLTTELIIITFISIFLIIVQPLASLTSFSLIGISVSIFYKFIHKKAGILGKKRQYYNRKMIQGINEGLGGIKEIKVLRREKFFIDEFINHSLKYSNISLWITTINATPRLFLETIAVTSILLIVIIILIQGKNIDSILPIISLFAIASFRLMPSANRILISLTSIRCHYHSVDVIYDDLELISENKTKNESNKSPEKILQFTDSITIKNIDYKYPNSSQYSLENISLSIPKNHSIAFIGASGAGKTTLVDIILGLLTPIQGEVLVDGNNIQNYLKDWQQKIGYIPQNIYLADDSILNNIAFGLPVEKIDKEKVYLALEASQLKELIDSLPRKLETKVGDRGIRLSGGQKQRIGIARALYHNPEILVMDEATAALDNETEREFIKALDRFSGKKTIIIIAHRLTTVQKCDRIYLMEKGKIVSSGNYDQLSTSCDKFMKLNAVK